MMTCVYLTADHSEGEDVDLLVVRLSVNHLRRHPVDVADDRLALVTAEHTAPAVQRRRRTLRHTAVRYVDVRAIADGDGPCQTEVRHHHRVILDQYTCRQRWRDVMLHTYCSLKTNDWALNKAGVKRETQLTVKARKLAHYGQP